MKDKVVRQIPRYLHDVGYNDDLQEADRDTTGRCTVNRLGEAGHSLPDDSDVDEYSSSDEETSSDNLRNKSDRRFPRDVSGATSRPYDEIFRIYGLNFWEEFGRPFSTSEAKSSVTSKSSASDGQAVIIMDNEALEHHLLTKSFLNDLLWIPVESCIIV